MKNNKLASYSLETTKQPEGLLNDSNAYEDNIYQDQIFNINFNQPNPPF